MMRPAAYGRLVVLAAACIGMSIASPSVALEQTGRMGADCDNVCAAATPIPFYWSGKSFQSGPNELTCKCKAYMGRNCAKIRHNVIEDAASDLRFRNPVPRDNVGRELTLDVYQAALCDPYGAWRNLDNGLTFQEPIDQALADIQKGLPLNLNPLEVSNTKIVNNARNYVHESGLYIFVLRMDGLLILRHADNPSDEGCWAEGNTEFHYAGNPPNEYFRHSQLAGGNPDLDGDQPWPGPNNQSSVETAGMVEVSDGLVLWIASDSGHYRPTRQSVLKALAMMREWGYHWTRKTKVLDRAPERGFRGNTCQEIFQEFHRR